MLLAQDTLVLLKIQSVRGAYLPNNEEPWQDANYLLKYSVMGDSVGISGSQAHQAVKRLVISGLIDKEMHVRANAALEWLVHGVKYAFPPVYGGIIRGMPTSYAAPPLISEIGESGEPPPVWAWAEGTVRGISLQPIYRTGPMASWRDPHLYEYLALLDALRCGRTRETSLAEKFLRQKFGVSS
jgi:hypothetical protein